MPKACDSSESDYSSSSSESEKKELPKKEKKIKELSEKIEKNTKNDDKIKETVCVLNKKLEKNTQNDKKIKDKLEKNSHETKHEIKELKSKVKHLEHKFKSLDNYETIVKFLRKEKCLMVNGSDVYGTFYCFNQQTVSPNNPLILEKSQNILNLDFDDNTPIVRIERSGVYVVNITCQFETPAQVALFINEIPELSSLTSSNLICIHLVLTLIKGDELSIRNYLTNSNITTALTSNGLIPETKNVVMNIWRIAPVLEKCSYPPKPNKHEWCYFDNSSESSTDVSE